MEHLTKETFKEKIYDYEKNEKWSYKGNRPAIIDFYASWCGPCKTLGPVLDDLAKEYSGRVDIFKVNTEDEEELSAVFGIRSIPSMLFIPTGSEPQMVTGALPKGNIKEIIQNLLKVK